MMRQSKILALEFFVLRECNAEGYVCMVGTMEGRDETRRAARRSHAPTVPAILFASDMLMIDVLTVITRIVLYYLVQLGSKKWSKWRGKMGVEPRDINISITSAVSLSFNNT